MKKLTLIIAIMLLISCIGGGISTAFTAAAATGNDFDNTHILDDLHDLDLTSFLNTQGKNVQIITFAEYCYAYRANMRQNYALYLYIYNPQRINFANNTSNQVQLATEYDAEGIPTDYSKFTLKLCSSVASGQYAGLFYKYKVIDTSSILATAADYERDYGVRRYDLSSVEILTSGQSNAIDYKIAASYRYTGYALGCGRYEDIDTLDCEVKDLDVVELEVQHVTFRPGTVSEKGAGYQNELNGVYFAIDNAILQKYGRLQRIKAEWYEYKTQPIVVTTSGAVNDRVKPLLGIDISKGYDANKVNSSVDLRILVNKSLIQNVSRYDVSYNAFVGSLWVLNSMHTFISDQICDRLAYLFYDNTKHISNYTVTAEDLEAYIKSYNKSATTGYLPIKDGQVSADLFLDGYVDEGRTFGYNIKEFDADRISDQFNLLSYDSNHSGWQRFLDFFLSNIDTSTDFKDIKPIVQVTDSDLSGTDQQIADRLHLPIEKVQSFKAFYSAQKIAGKQTYIFWCASNEYFAKNAKIDWTNGADNNNTEIRQTTVRMSFDILVLTFNKAGTYTALAAVSNPIDMVPNLTPGLTDETIFPYFLVIFLALLLLVIFVLFPSKMVKRANLKRLFALLLLLAVATLLIFVILQSLDIVSYEFVENVIEIGNTVQQWFVDAYNWVNSLIRR